jgi:hypothetical protein
MAKPDSDQFEARHIYRAFRAERNQALHRVLGALPYDFIVALIEGLEEADVITPGRLFAGHRGGCAVGVTLRALDPSYQGRRLIWGRRLRRSIVGFRRSLAVRVRHLYALEQVFDRSVRLLKEEFPHVPESRVAEATAHWVAGEARTELLLREMNSDWIDRALAEMTAPASAANPVAVAA